MSLDTPSALKSAGLASADLMNRRLKIVQIKLQQVPQIKTWLCYLTTYYVSVPQFLSFCKVRVIIHKIVVKLKFATAGKAFRTVPGTCLVFTK